MNPEAVGALQDVFEAITARYGVSHMTSYMFVQSIEAIIPLAPEYAKTHVVAQLHRMEGKIGKAEFLELMTYLKSSCWTTPEDIVKAARDEARRQRMAPKGYDETNPYLQRAVPSLSVNEDLQEQLHLHEDVIVEQQRKIQRMEALLSASGIDVRLAEAEAAEKRHSEMVSNANVTTGTLSATGDSLNAGSSATSPPPPPPPPDMDESPKKSKKDKKGKKGAVDSDLVASPPPSGAAPGDKQQYGVDAVLYLENRCQKAEDQLRAVSSRLAALGDYTGPNSKAAHQARALAQEMSQYENYSLNRMMKAQQRQREFEEAAMAQHQQPRAIGTVPPRTSGSTPLSPTRHFPHQPAASHTPHHHSINSHDATDPNSFAAVVASPTPNRVPLVTTATQNPALSFTSAVTVPSMDKTDTILPSASMLTEEAVMAVLTDTPLRHSKNEQRTPIVAQTDSAKRMHSVYHMLDLEKTNTLSSAVHHYPTLAPKSYRHGAPQSHYMAANDEERQMQQARDDAAARYAATATGGGSIPPAAANVSAVPYPNMDQTDLSTNGLVATPTRIQHAQLGTPFKRAGAKDNVPSHALASPSTFVHEHPALSARKPVENLSGMTPRNTSAADAVAAMYRQQLQANSSAALYAPVEAAAGGHYTSPATPMQQQQQQHQSSHFNQGASPSSSVRAFNPNYDVLEDQKLRQQAMTTASEGGSGRWLFTPDFVRK